MERRLGNYTIQGEIGRGGMATVYRAVQESLNRIVALKELDLARIRSEPNSLDRFRLEARAAAALEHPNIVSIYDLWEEENKAYIAMEFVDGVELKDTLVNLGQIHYLSAVLIALAVSEALQYAHLKGMVHRDVKPGNIMLAASGEVRLMDFGIVSISGGGDLTVSGQILGTPAYMSPEQIAGEKLGPQADIFSLGAVLYEMISGVKAFQGSNHIALIQSVLHGRPALLHELVQEVPESVSRAVDKCLQKDPASRYGSMEEFKTVLEMILPLERPDRRTVVKRLVQDTREQERTRLQSNTGEDDRTTPQPVTSFNTEFSGQKPDPVTEKSPKPEETKTAGATLARGEGDGIYDLEDAPPADLPPLESPDTRTAAETDFEPEGAPEQPLTLKDLPPQEPEAGPESKKPSADKRSWGIIGIAAVLIVAGVIAWRFMGGPKPAEMLEKATGPPAKARITIVAEPAGRVFMDGQLMGLANPSLSYEVAPGLHRLQVRHPRFGSKKFILEVKEGEEKEVEVYFGK